jgi:4-amino-4-deoxy-L-arabinose transferase-like glycosyltransferase
VILEASSTQNDLVISFFVVSAVYFCYNYLIHNAKDNLVFAGIAIGLSMLTKGTAALYILPVVVIFVMLCLILILKKSIRFVPFFYLISLLLIPLAINMGHFYRNYKLTQNILGTDSRESRMYSNAKMSTVLLISNQIKNVAVHVGCFPFNRLADTLIYKMHSTFGIDINNSGTNFCDMEYHGIVAIPTCEDTAPNTMHFYIIMSSVLLILVMYKKQNKYQFYCFAIYILLILFQTLLFSGLLRWQPWASRLHIPYFLLSIPVVLYAINTISSYRKIMLVIIPLLIIASIIPLSLNVYKPLVYSKYTNNIKVTDPLYKKYFAIRPYLYKEYNEIYDIIKSCQYRMVGLIVGADDWEYPIFDKFTDCKIKYFHINVKNNPSMLLNRGNENIDCIITTIADNSNKIDYNAKIFYNQSPNNKYIWIYR